MGPSSVSLRSHLLDTFAEGPRGAFSDSGRSRATTQVYTTGGTQVAGAQGDGGTPKLKILALVIVDKLK